MSPYCINLEDATPCMDAFSLVFFQWWIIFSSLGVLWRFLCVPTFKTLCRLVVYAPRCNIPYVDLYDIPFVDLLPLIPSWMSVLLAPLLWLCLSGWAKGFTQSLPPKLKKHKPMSRQNIRWQRSNNSHTIIQRCRRPRVGFKPKQPKSPQAPLRKPRPTKDYL